MSEGVLVQYIFTFTGNPFLFLYRYAYSHCMCLVRLIHIVSLSCGSILNRKRDNEIGPLVDQ